MTDNIITNVLTVKSMVRTRVYTHEPLCLVTSLRRRSTVTAPLSQRQGAHCSPRAGPGPRVPLCAVSWHTAAPLATWCLWLSSCCRGGAEKWQRPRGLKYLLPALYRESVPTPLHRASRDPGSFRSKSHTACPSPRKCFGCAWWLLEVKFLQMKWQVTGQVWPCETHRPARSSVLQSS